MIFGRDKATPARQGKAPYLGIPQQPSNRETSEIEHDGYDPTPVQDTRQAAEPTAGIALEATSGEPSTSTLPQQTPAPLGLLGGTTVDDVVPPQNSPARAVLLLEHPGPWAAEPLETATLPAAVRTALSTFGRAQDVEILLLQRPDGGNATARAVFLSTPDNEGLLVRSELASLVDLETLDLAGALAQVRSCQVPDGWHEAEPIITLATNASTTQRLLGPGLAATLNALDPDNVWESSHALGRTDVVTALALPAGQLYAPIEPTSASSILDASWQSRVLLSQFVGHVHHNPVQQLAEVALRRRLGADAEASVFALDSTEVRIATGDQGEPGALTINRVITRWQVFPRLVADPALARMVPDLGSEPTRTWRVVVDRSNLTGSTGDTAEEHLSVIEVADEQDPGQGVHDWDDTHTQAAGPLPLPDPTVVAEITALTPGSALDLGCGSGRHALWLAAQGWLVTGVDFSRSGLWRMADEASRRQVAVRAELADLRVWTPGGTRYDLILVSHLHLDEVFQRASPWLAPGGRIVVIGPAKRPALEGRADGSTIDYVRLAARATGARLRVLRAGEVERITDAGPVRDAIVVATRAV